MKKWMLTFVAAVAVTAASAQSSSPSKSDSLPVKVQAGVEDGDDVEIFAVPDTLPEYPGGQAAFLKFVVTRMRYPAICAENGIQGNVVVKFVVNTDGSLSDFSVVSKTDPALNKEAVRVLRLSPRWKPGMRGGRPVRSWMRLPVAFRL